MSLQRALTWAFVLMAIAFVPMTAAAQSAATAEDAKPFLGKWALKLESPMGPFEMDLTVAADGGKVTADIGGGQLPITKVTDISKVDADLLLKYDLDVQGMVIPANVKLTPDGADLKVDFDLADGMFTMNGAGKKAS